MKVPCSSHPSHRGAGARRRGAAGCARQQQRACDHTVWWSARGRAQAVWMQTAMDSAATQGREVQRAAGARIRVSPWCAWDWRRLCTDVPGGYHAHFLVSRAPCPYGIACNRSYPRARAKGHGGQLASAGGENDLPGPETMARRAWWSQAD